MADKPARTLNSLISERAFISIVLLLTGCALLIHTYSLGFADLGGAFSPVFFPRIILTAWITLALLSLIADVLSVGRSASNQWVRVVVVAIAMFAYIKLMQPLGFFICSVVFCAIVLLVTGQRRVRDVVIFSILLPGALLLLFNHILVMPLPVSPFFWWL